MSQRYVSDELTHFVGRDLPDNEARYALLLKILRDGFLSSDPDSPQTQESRSPCPLFLTRIGGFACPVGFR